MADNLILKALLERYQQQQTTTTNNSLSNIGRILASIEKSKRKVFISYHHANDLEVKEFIKKWTETNPVFIPKALGISNADDFINSTNPEYVISKIREKYLQDSTVTIVLIGKCTHSRRYVDWEIKASLKQGENTTPNGLFGILLPSAGGSAFLPQRFQDNLHKTNDSYASFYNVPQNAQQLSQWIEKAYKSRTSKTNLISNSQDMMKYNGVCRICNITH